MSTKLLRTLATLFVAFGLIAGSLGTAVAGRDLDVDLLNPDGDIETDGGDGGDGGNTGQQNGGGDNTNGNNQGNDQDQTQDPNQDQTVNQDNTNDLDQGNHLSTSAGGDAGGDCVIFQPDVSSVVVDEADEDEIAGDAATNGDDDADCDVGDSTVGDGSTGDTNQANAGDADAANSSSQEQVLGDQDNVNEPVHSNEQELQNNLDADAGDGADGGEATNTGSVDVANEIVVTLVNILRSIIGDDNQDTIGTGDPLTLVEVCADLQVAYDADDEDAGLVLLDEAIDAGIVLPGTSLEALTFGVCGIEERE